MIRWCGLLSLTATLTFFAPAQTTQAIIAGQIIDTVTGNPVENARVVATNSTINVVAAGTSSASGYYVVPLLPPGIYQVRVIASQYQPQQVENLQLAVSAAVGIDFQLRPLNDVWESGRYRSLFLPNSESVLTFFGPDVDTSRSESVETKRARTSQLESSISQIIDPVEIRDLPLAGRDVYTMLATQAAVTADSSTARGLGLAINGQRPSSSIFLLDGLENNNYLLTGPQTTIAPEAVQEYRISISSFSPEYGRTGGYLANAVTRSGSRQWHGLAYGYVKNDALNANDFQENAAGAPRPPLKEYEFGYQTGGTLRKDKLFLSSAFDGLRSRGHGEVTNITLPTMAFFEFTDPQSIANDLLRRFPSAVIKTSGDEFSVQQAFEPPVSLNHSLALERLDHIMSDGAHRQMVRVAFSRLTRPDFIWSPYKEFVSSLTENDLNVAFGSSDILSPEMSLESKLGWGFDDLGWSRAHSEIPTLASFDGTLLPGSPAFYGFRNRSHNLELLENLSWIHGRHLVKAGGGALLRHLNGYLTAGRDGRYLFDTLLDFALDQPDFYQVSVARQPSPQLQSPHFDRAYRYNQFQFFFQDTFRLTRRFSLNYGVRYENFGAPANSGAAADTSVVLGPGSDFSERLSSAKLAFTSGAGKTLYGRDNNGWAPRLGFSYGLFHDGNTTLHGAFGLFYDRPFDNLWQDVRNNSFVLATFNAQSGNYLAPLPTILQSYTGQAFAPDFPHLTLFRKDFQNPYVETYFLGIEQRLKSNWSLTINGMGALGRRLITTDQVNRRTATYNSDLPLISYRGNQGSSSYHALAMVIEGRVAGGHLHAAYTWSHSIDNQSDPLAGDFFDLSFAGTSPVQPSRPQAGFTRQFDSHIDRGNSDFDQRHNFVFYSIWNLPGPSSFTWASWLLRDWKLSELAAFRTGEPYTVLANSGLSLVHNRADLAVTHLDNSAPVLGGIRLLNAADFRQPPDGQVGNLGRNALYGPGIFNVDASLSKALPLPRLGEAARLVLRADAFNILNHANLNNPDSRLGDSTFGIALYGRKGFDTGFPALAPLNERAREIQLLLRVEF